MFVCVRRRWFQTSNSFPNTLPDVYLGFFLLLKLYLVSDKKYKIHMAEEKPKGSDLAGSEEETPLILSLFPLCL